MLDLVSYMKDCSYDAAYAAELLRDVPGMMMRLGVAGPDGCAPLHNGAFALDETALVVGIEVLAATLLAWLEEHGG